MNSKVFVSRYLYMGLASVLFLSFFLIVSACSSDSSEEVPEEIAQEVKQVNVVTTIYPLEYYATRIGGEYVKVTSLAGVGVDAHTIELTPSQLQGMQNADLMFANGLMMEPWFERALTSLGAEAVAKTHYLSEFEFTKLEFEDGHDDHDEHKDGHDDHDEHKDGHDDHDEHKDGHEGHEGHAHGEFDPHIWLDPLYAIKQSKAVLEALSAKDPSNMDYYLGNYQKLEQDLQSLHQDYTNGLSSCKHEEFVISHAAFGYIAARYNLEQIEIAGLSAEALPSAARLAEIAERVGKLGLGSVLVEALQWDNSVSQTLANESNLQAVPVHVIGTVTRDELNEHADYMGLMRNNLKSLQTAMECSA